MDFDTRKIHSFASQRDIRGASFSIRKYQKISQNVLVQIETREVPYVTYLMAKNYYL